MAAKGSKHADHPEIPLKTYFGVFAALIILTVVTVVASRFDFGAMNTVIALVIASIKASMVLAIFMHLKYDDKLYLVGIFTAVFLLLLMYLFSVLDIFTRIAYHNIL